MPTQAEIRDALRILHGTAPEATALVEGHIDKLEDQVRLLSQEDAFRAFVLEQARQSGATHSVLTQLNSGVLQDLAAIEKNKTQTALLDAQSRVNQTVTWQQVLTQPVAIAVISGLSTAGAALFSFIKTIWGG